MTPNLSRTIFVALLTLGTLAGCATNFEPTPLPAGHPASVQTQEAPRSATRRLIMTDELTRKTDTQLARKEIPNPDFQNSEMAHDMGKMDHSKMQMPAPAPSAAASPASKEAVETEMKKTSDEMKKLSDELKTKSDAAKSTEKPSPTPAQPQQPKTAYWTCVMHPEIHSDKPGQCPKCGMTLVKKEGAPK